MKNIIKSSISLLFISALLFSSCETVDDVVMPRSQKPTVEVATPSVSVTKGNTATITIQTAAAAKAPLTFKLVQISGNAAYGSDYKFSSRSYLDYGPVGGQVIIATGATTGSVTISGLSGHSGSLSAGFELRAIKEMNGLVGTAKNVSVTIVP